LAIYIKFRGLAQSELFLLFCFALKAQTAFYYQIDVLVCQNVPQAIAGHDNKVALHQIENRSIGGRNNPTELELLVAYGSGN
jgi:hypothetical protein